MTMADKAGSSGEEDSEGTAVKVKNAADLQRLKLEKLMKQHEKPVYIPDRPKEKKMRQPPEFIRNTWGSSAGAGSGDFHVYRGVRRREYARQKFLSEKTEKEQKDVEYQQKIQENIKTAEERTAKKRAKRLKKKQKAKMKRNEKEKPPSSESDEESETENTENAGKSPEAGDSADKN